MKPWGRGDGVNDSAAMRSSQIMKGQGGRVPSPAAVGGTGFQPVHHR